MIHHSRTVRFVRLPSQPTSSCFSATVLFVGCSIGSPIAHTEGPLATPSECIVQLFVRSFDLTNHCLCCSHFFAYTHHSMLQHLLFRCLSPLLFGSQMEEQQNVPQPNWTHGGITLVTIWCVFHVDYTALVTHTGVERHNAIKSRPTRSRHLVRLSLIIRWASLAMSVHRRCHCALCLQHTTLPKQTPLRNSPSRSFCSCVTLNTPSGAQFHSDFMKTPREAQTASNTGNEMAAAFADAATQLSFAEFFERCILSRPSRRVPTPAPHYFRMHLLRLPTQCRLRRCYHPTPAHRVLSWVRLLR